MAAVISPAMARFNAKNARKERIAAGRARRAAAATEVVVIDADSGDILADGFSTLTDANRWAADRSHGDRSLVAIRL